MNAVLPLGIVLLFSTINSMDLWSNSVETRLILNKIISSERSYGRSSHISQCYTGNSPSDTNENYVPVDNSFLDMANFMEYVQMTHIPESTVSQAINFFNVSVAAFDFGNLIVAQENFARACSVLENSNKRSRARRDVRPEPQYSAADLFEEMKYRLGNANFKKFLHLEREAVFAFVIDTSSSMANDMNYVRQYIEQILIEQTNSGIKATYIVGTYAENPSSPKKTFTDKGQLMKYIKSLKPSVGGDCEEKTCTGIKRTIGGSPLFSRGNSAVFVFTDASSKDCSTRNGQDVIRLLRNVKAPVFFILFDSCETDIDTHYVHIAQKTLGFCLLIRENGIYNITDTVNGAFGVDSMIVGENSALTFNLAGQGVSHYGPLYNRGQSGYYSEERKKRDIQDVTSKKEFLIDDLIQSFKVYVKISPPELLKNVKLHKPLTETHHSMCSDSNLRISKSTADNGIVFGVDSQDCPCVGYWTLSFPSSAASTFSYIVKSNGDYTLSFDAYFVDEIIGSRVANYAPCLGVEEYLVVKVSQGEHVIKDSLSVKLFSLGGNVVFMTPSLEADPTNSNTYIAKVNLPSYLGTGEFSVLLEGKIIGGNPFQRHSPTVFKPTESCFRVVKVANYYALTKPNQRISIKLQLTNNSPSEEVYSVVCYNSENYHISMGKPQIRTERGRLSAINSNPFPLGPAKSGILTALIASPAVLSHGKTVVVTCTATSSIDEMVEEVSLTEIENSFNH